MRLILGNQRQRAAISLWQRIVIPCQPDRGKVSHATDPGKPEAEGSHFIVAKNHDSMPTADQVSKAGKGNHATDPGKQEGSHFIMVKNRDSMPTADRVSKAGKVSHATDPGKPEDSHFIVAKNRDSMLTAD